MEGFVVDGAMRDVCESSCSGVSSDLSCKGNGCGQLLLPLPALFKPCVRGKLRGFVLCIKSLLETSRESIIDGGLFCVWRRCCWFRRG